MAKVAKIDRPGTHGMQYLFECPGCGCAHGFRTEGAQPLWSFNGNMEKPTLSPSLKVTSGDANGPTMCHSFVRDGRIQFLDDCTHSLAGQTVSLPEID